MKRWHRTAVLIFWLAAAAFGQSPPPGADEEAEWTKIRGLKALYEEAVSANQVEKLRPFVARNFRGILVNGSEARSFDDLVKRNREIWDLIGSGGSYKVKVNHEPGAMFGDLAVAHGNAEEVVVTGMGKRFEFQSTWLVNLVKEDGEWKLYRIQATMDPVGNVFVQDTVKYSRLAFGGGGLLLGAALGFFIRRRR